MTPNIEKLRSRQNELYRIFTIAYNSDHRQAIVNTIQQCLNYDFVPMVLNKIDEKGFICYGEFDIQNVNWEYVARVMPDKFDMIERAISSGQTPIIFQTFDSSHHLFRLGVISDIDNNGALSLKYVESL